MLHNIYQAKLSVGCGYNQLTSSTLPIPDTSSPNKAKNLSFVHASTSFDLLTGYNIFSHGYLALTDTNGVIAIDINQQYLNTTASLSNIFQQKITNYTIKIVQRYSIHLPI